jgi:hypothetical protein
MRSLAFILLRRFLFLPPPQLRIEDIHVSPPALYDHLPPNTLLTVERLLLYSLAHEPVPAVRQVAADAITALTDHYLHKLGRPWAALCTQVVTMVKSQNATLRESAFGVFAASQMLIMGMQIVDMLPLLKGGLEDTESAVSLIIYHSLSLIFSSRSAFLLYVPPRTTS